MAQLLHALATRPRQLRRQRGRQMGVLQLVRASLHRMRSTSHLVCRMGGRVARLVQRVRGGMPHLVCRMGGVVPRLDILGFQCTRRVRASNGFAPRCVV